MIDHMRGLYTKNYWKYFKVDDQGHSNDMDYISLQYNPVLFRQWFFEKKNLVQLSS